MEAIPRSAYWIVVLTATVVLLAAANAVASSDAGLSGLFGRARKPVANKFSNSRQGRAVLVVKSAKPGGSGKGRVVLANVGSRPFRKVLLTQDRVKQGGVSSALQLQVYDAVTKKCLYPRPKLPKVKPGARPPKEPKVCLAWAPFNAGKALRKFSVPPVKGTTWTRREKHAIDVRWRLDPSSPNTDQGRTASFRLTWTATA